MARTMALQQGFRSIEMGTRFMLLCTKSSMLMSHVGLGCVKTLAGGGEA
jgi:hypothetical protein